MLPALSADNPLLLFLGESETRDIYVLLKSILWHACLCSSFATV